MIATRRTPSGSSLVTLFHEEHRGGQTAGHSWRKKQTVRSEFGTGYRLKGSGRCDCSSNDQRSTIQAPKRLVIKTSRPRSALPMPRKGQLKRQQKQKSVSGATQALKDAIQAERAEKAEVEEAARAQYWSKIQDWIVVAVLATVILTSMYQSYQRMYRAYQHSELLAWAGVAVFLMTAYRGALLVSTRINLRAPYQPRKTQGQVHIPVPNSKSRLGCLSF